MATEERYLPVLQRWQRNKFRPFEVNLIDAAKAARERRNEVVHPVQQGGKWLVSVLNFFDTLILTNSYVFVCSMFIRIVGNLLYSRSPSSGPPMIIC